MKLLIDLLSKKVNIIKFNFIFLVESNKEIFKKTQNTSKKSIFLNFSDKFSSRYFKENKDNIIQDIKNNHGKNFKKSYQFKKNYTELPDEYFLEKGIEVSFLTNI